MNRFVRWMRRVLEIDQLETWCFERESSVMSSDERTLNSLKVMESKLRSLSHQTLTNAARPRTELKELRDAIDFLTADVQELKTAMKAQGRNDVRRTQKPRR